MIEERHPARHRLPLELTAMKLATKRVQKGDVHGRWVSCVQVLRRPFH
jgi:hypothetical protein